MNSEQLLLFLTGNADAPLGSFRCRHHTSRIDVRVVCLVCATDHRAVIATNGVGRFIEAALRLGVPSPSPPQPNTK